MNQLTTTKPTVPAALTPEEFYALRDVPPEAEWFANIDNPNTRRAYRHDIRDFRRVNQNGGWRYFETDTSPVTRIIVARDTP
jgi:hypothetical protein